MRRFAMLAILLMGVAACGGDDDVTGPPPDADVSGDWAYANDLTGTFGGDPATCSMSGVTLTLSESGSSFNGGSITCVVDGQQFPPSPLSDALVVGLSVNGNTVVFAANTFGGMEHDGSVNGSSMSGTVTADAPELDTSLSGDWSAIK